MLVQGHLCRALLRNSQFLTPPPHTTTRTSPPTHQRHNPSTIVEKHHQQHFCSPSPSRVIHHPSWSVHHPSTRTATRHGGPSSTGSRWRQTTRTGPAKQGALNDGPCHLQRDTPWPPTHLDRRGEDVPESPRQQMARAPSHTTGPLAHTPDGGKQRPTNPRRRVFSLNLGRSTRNFNLASSAPNSPRLPRRPSRQILRTISINPCQR